MVQSPSNAGSDLRIPDVEPTSNLAEAEEPLVSSVDLRPNQNLLDTPLRRRNRRNAAVGRRTMYQMVAAKARQKLKSENPGLLVETIDTVSKFLFPFLYLTFNVIYWFAFLYWIPDEIDSIPSIKKEYASRRAML